MPRKLYTESKLVIPDGVKVTVDSRDIVVKGPRGELKRSFKHVFADIFLSEKNGKPALAVGMWYAKPKMASSVHSVVSHVRNMITGVTKGFRYKMKFVYAHFPISTTIPDDGKFIQIRNYLGEKRMREVKMYDGVKVIRSDQKDEIWIEGNNLESVSQSAANIHISTLAKNKDIRKFLDGTYVSETGLIVQDD